MNFQRIVFHWLGILFIPFVANAESDSARELKQLAEQHEKALAETAEPIQRRYQASLEALLCAGEARGAKKLKQ